MAQIIRVETAMENQLLIGANGDKRVALTLRMANRHGLITGATGTGKTITLQTLAEDFSRTGVPVFMADVKGDLSGIARAGTPNEKIQQRMQQLTIADYQNTRLPGAALGFVRQARPADSRQRVEPRPAAARQLLELNDTQTGVLYAAFKIADANGLLLLDMKDLRALLTLDGRQRQNAAEPVRQPQRRPVSRRFNANCSCSKNRAPINFSASRKSHSPI